MGPVDNKFIQLLLRRMPTVASASRHLSSSTLVLQQFYSPIVAVACPMRSEGFGNSAQQGLILLLRLRPENYFQ